MDRQLGSLVHMVDDLLALSRARPGGAATRALRPRKSPCAKQPTPCTNCARRAGINRSCPFHWKRCSSRDAGFDLHLTKPADLREITENLRKGK